MGDEHVRQNTLLKEDLIGKGQGFHKDTEFFKDTKESTLEEEEKIPKVGLVMSLSIFPFTILPGAGSANTTEMMTSVWHIRSAVAFYFTPW